MKNTLAIGDFMENHGLDTDQKGNCRFKGKVEYNSTLLNTSVVTDILFIRNGWQDGEIQLEETVGLSISQYHLDFKPDFQEYTFDSSTKTLVIEGSSNKMGGKYSVTISPV